jgi:nitroreductase
MPGVPGGNLTGMTDMPVSRPSHSGTPGAIPSTAEALARLDMPLVDAMMTQRAVRRVLPDAVADEVVLKCIELALKAPTGANGQQWEFIVVRDGRTKKKLAKRYRLGWSAYYYAVMKRRAARDESAEKTVRAVKWQVDHFTEVPVLVVACMRLGVREGRMPFLRMPHPAESGYYGSIYPGVQNLLLAARAMGLGVERHVSAQNPEAAAERHAMLHRAAWLASWALRPDHPQARGTGCALRHVW